MFEAWRRDTDEPVFPLADWIQHCGCMVNPVSVVTRVSTATRLSFIHIFQTLSFLSIASRSYFPGLRRPAREVDNSLPYGAKDKKEWFHTLF